MSFLLDEDEALRNLLKEMTVTDQKAASVTAKTITQKALTTNVATLTTSTAHEFEVGDTVTVSNVGTPFNGSYIITAIPSPTSFRYAKVNTNIASVASGGSVTLGANRKVGVWFGQPDQEIRNQSYPYITIDMIDISEDIQRAMRGRVKPVYLSNPTTIDGTAAYNANNHNWEINYPIPVNIDYQITTYSRQPRHDRQILAQLLYTKIPLRFAVLETGPNSVAGTTRRLDVLDISKRDITEQGKRLFVNAITVRVSSEIAPEVYTKLYKALELNVTGTTGSQVIGRGQFTTIDSYTQSAP
jgi:hypothetical protein